MSLITSFPCSHTVFLSHALLQKGRKDCCAGLKSYQLYVPNTFPKILIPSLLQLLENCLIPHL